MTHPFTSKQLPFFLTAPSPCPYLKDQEERKVFTKLEPGEGRALNDALTHVGFRRSQSILYRPACERCAACKSARIPVHEFKPSRSQKRVDRKASDLTRHVRHPEATPEQYGVLSRYLEARHAEGDMAGMDFFEYASMVEDGADSAEIVEYRDEDDRLIAAVLTDHLSDGFSMVYSFFEPERAQDSLGTFIILDQIRRAKETGLNYIYLGYWVPGSPKMNYKARFQPLEILEPTGWRILSKEERTAAEKTEEFTDPVQSV